MSRLELAMLGSFRVAVDGDPVETFHYEKVRALLAYLAAEPGQSHTRSALAGLLWPNRPEAVARQSLSQALSTLRRALCESEAVQPFLIATHQEIHFNGESEHEFDKTRFLTLLTQCEEHGHANLAACAPCLERLRHAITLYRGDFLKDVAVADAPEFQEWLLVQQARLLGLVTDALNMTAAAYEERRQYREALVYARRRLELTPWQEDSHRQVMRLLALDGRRLDALQQFEVCRQTMRAEMDIEPETETLALYERILSGAEIVPMSQGPPHNLQAQLTPLIGRDTELATVTEYLRSPDCRLLVLVGPGGSGKSRLSVEAAQHLLAGYADGVYLVSLTSLYTAQPIVPAIAQTVGLNLYESTSPATQLQQFLRNKRILLVLDNFEHLLEGASEISRLLHATQHLRILVTSRARLNLKSEQVVRLGGLETPDVDTVPEGDAQDRRAIPEYPAVQLFIYQARRSAPRFSPNLDEMADIGRICRAVNGLPLSILLAASWMDLVTVAEIAERVSGAASVASGAGFDFLETDWQDVSPRHRSMRTVLDHSWQMSDPAGQRILSRLSVFRGEFTAEAAQQVAGASLRQLKVLADRSLLESTQAGRYLLHEHLRQYAAVRLAEMAPEAPYAVGSLHAAYYIQRLRDHGVALRDHRQGKAVSVIASEFDNIRVAWRWSTEYVDIEKLAGGSDGLFQFLAWKFRLQEGRSLFDMAATGLQAAGSRQHPCVVAEVLTRKAAFCRLLGSLDEARSLIREARGLVESAEKSDTDTQHTRALVLEEQGHVIIASMPAEAEVIWRESLALFRELDDRWQIAQVLNNLSDTMGIQADWEDVQRLSEEALQIQRALGDQRGTIRSLQGLCTVFDNRGQIDVAIAHLEEAKQISRDLGDQFGVAKCEFHIGIEFMYLGKFSDAYSVFQSAACGADELGAESLHAWILHFLTWDCVNQGRYTRARGYSTRSLSLFRQLGEADGVAFVHLSSGEVLLAEGAVEQARLMFKQSLQEFRKHYNRDGECLTLNALTLAEIAAGNFARAHGCIAQALAITVDTSDYGPALGALLAASLCKACSGETEEAVELYSLACKHPYIAESRYRHDVAGKHIMHAASMLPTDRHASAQRRGKARDLMATIRELDAEFNV